MTSQWTHAICDKCWTGNRPDYARHGLPHRMVPPKKERCCFCAGETESGIYVRRNPDFTPCHGEHKELGKIKEP